MKDKPNGFPSPPSRHLRPKIWKNLKGWSIFWKAWLFSSYVLQILWGGRRCQVTSVYDLGSSRNKNDIPETSEIVNYQTVGFEERLTIYSSPLVACSITCGSHSSRTRTVRYGPNDFRTTQGCEDAKVWRIFEAIEYTEVLGFDQTNGQLFRFLHVEYALLKIDGKLGELQV